MKKGLMGMNDRMIRHYFVDSNSSQGYADLSEASLGSLEQLIRLNDYPQPAVDEILSAVSSYALEKGLEVEHIHNCLSNKLKGVVLPELSAGIVFQEPWYPGTLSVTAALDHPELNAVKEALRAAWEGFERAKIIHDRWEKIYIANLDILAADAQTDEVTELLFQDKKLDKEAAYVERFFGAATVDGSFDYIQNLTQTLSRRYFLKGRPGTGKSTFLKKIAAQARKRGYDTEAYRCALDPNSFDMVVVRELDFCIFDSTSPHEYFPSRTGDEIIDIYKAAVVPCTDEKYAARLTDAAGEYKAEVRVATEFLRKAIGHMDAFQRTYLYPLDEDVIEAQKIHLLQAIF